MPLALTLKVKGNSLALAPLTRLRRPLPRMGEAKIETIQRVTITPDRAGNSRINASLEI